MSSPFNPIDYEAALEAAGVSHDQAIIHAKALVNARSELCIKADLDAVRAELAHFRSDVDHSLQSLEARMMALEARMTAQIETLRAEIRVQAARMDSLVAEMRIMRWAMGFMFAMQVGILAKLFTL